MPITYPLNAPAVVGPSRVRFGRHAKVSVGEGEFTFDQWVTVHQGQRWSMEASFEVLDRTNAEEWVAMLNALNGREGTFLFGDPMGKTPRGAGGGTPLVNGGGQLGRTLATDGWPASTTVLRKGDWFQLGTGATARLYKLVLDAVTNGSGQVTLDFWPALRGSPVDNAALIVTNTVGLWRLASNDQYWDIEDVLYRGVTFSAVEALP